mgnify:CR=1 FL=1
METRVPDSKNRCYTDLKLRILRTDLEPGLVLDEALLAAHSRLSRTALREVLLRLAWEGYITLVEHRGANVSSMDVAPACACPTGREIALHCHAINCAVNLPGMLHD